jgi:hypothetical protein
LPFHDWRNHVAKPKIASDIAVHYAVVGLIRHVNRRTEVWINSGITNQAVNAPPGVHALLNQGLQLFFSADVTA